MNIKLNDKELDKLIKILGLRRVKELWCESKIYLTKEQLDYLCNKKENE